MTTSRDWKREGVTRLEAITIAVLELRKSGGGDVVIHRGTCVRFSEETEPFCTCAPHIYPATMDPSEMLAAAEAEEVH